MIDLFENGNHIPIDGDNEPFVRVLWKDNHNQWSLLNSKTRNSPMEIFVTTKFALKRAFLSDFKLLSSSLFLMRWDITCLDNSFSA